MNPKLINFQKHKKLNKPYKKANIKRIIEYLSVSSNLIVSYKELTEYIPLPIINPLKG